MSNKNLQSKSLRLSGTVEDSIVDGPGLRYAIFVQGCPHKCFGCHNPQSHDYTKGYEIENDNLCEIINKNKIIQGITLTGGEPFSQAQSLIDLVEKLQTIKSYDIWIYSGYIYEDLIQGHPNKWAPRLLELCNVLVDGPFIEQLKSYDLIWKGSSNQRVIDLKSTHKTGHIVLWKNQNLEFEIPSSW